jgi:hypothetical protein
MNMAKNSDERSYPKHLALLALLFLSVGATDTASAQLLQQQPSQQQHAQVRRTATRINPPERTNTTTNTTPVPAALPGPAIDQTTALGQALTACDQEADQGPFTLPGLKGEVTLDRCYKGRAHLICFFTAIGTEAKSLTSSYTKIVDAKYPDLNTVDSVCHVSLQSLAADIAGSEDFAKRFKELKSQYEAATKCTSSVEQAFKDVSLADLTKAPEVLQSMTTSIDGDVAKISETQKQISDLSAKMELSNKAMKVVTKLHHAMCTNEKVAEQSGGVEHR